MGKSYSISIPSDLKYVKRSSQAVLDSLKSLNLVNHDLLDVRLCLEEALINAIKYGNKFNKDNKVKLNCSVNNDKLQISVEDKGEGYDYDKLPDPTLEENLQELKGRGVFLIRRLMDEVRFNDKGNLITMIKYLKKGD